MAAHHQAAATQAHAAHAAAVAAAEQLIAGSSGSSNHQPPQQTPEAAASTTFASAADHMVQHEARVAGLQAAHEAMHAAAVAAAGEGGVARGVHNASSGPPPARADMIAALEEVCLDLHTVQAGNTSCGVCLNPQHVGDRAVVLPRCGHAFHKDSCLVPWLEQHNTCPTCRTPLLATAAGGAAAAAAAAATAPHAAAAAARQQAHNATVAAARDRMAAMNAEESESLRSEQGEAESAGGAEGDAVEAGSAGAGAGASVTSAAAVQQGAETPTPAPTVTRTASQTSSGGSRTSPPSPPVEQPSQHQIAVGQTVTISGLLSRPRLNGTQAIVAASRAGRWVVTPVGGGASLALRPECLKPASALE